MTRLRHLPVRDHAPAGRPAPGSYLEDAARFKEQIKTINRLNEKLDSIVRLKGIEVDILKDGSLDLPDEILKKVDLITRFSPGCPYLKLFF